MLNILNTTSDEKLRHVRFYRTLTKATVFFAVSLVVSGSVSADRRNDPRNVTADRCAPLNANDINRRHFCNRPREFVKSLSFLFIFFLFLFSPSYFTPSAPTIVLTPIPVREQNGGCITSSPNTSRSRVETPFF